MDGTTTSTATSASSAMSAPPELRRAISAIEGDERIDRLIGPMEQATAPLARGSTASVLRGEWLGHALHPLLTDFPLGCWLSAGLLDLVGGRGTRKAAQRLVGLGLLAVPATAASGWSDWSTLREPRTRRVGVVHGLGNTAVALLYYRSWKARRRGHQLRGVAYGLVGGAGAWVTGYLGGHLSFARQAGTGERGLDGGGPDAPTRRDGNSALDDDGIVDLTGASELIGAPEAQVRSMVDEGLLAPVSTEPELRFRAGDARAVRLLGG